MAVRKAKRGARRRATRKPTRKVGYAVVGLGHIAQAAVLPAFKNATGNSELVALVSDDPKKQEKLGKKYGVPVFGYADYERCLQLPEVEAVYIALPNSMHAEYTVRAANAGVHVLCEKPMATSSEECLQMIRACQSNDVCLMIAYRLHFEEANLKVVDQILSGKIGEPRLFNSTFTFQVKDENIRVRPEVGGGPLWDIGIYCVNASRYCFRAEPEEVMAFASGGKDKRFEGVEEGAAVAMRFPEERLASFVTSYGAVSSAFYDVVGTKGEICVDNAYEYSGELTWEMWIGERKPVERTVPKRDQFGPELVYFSDCIVDGREPEPNGWEGLADVRIIEALYESIRTGRPVRLDPFEKPRRPTARQLIRRPAVQEPELVNAEAPSSG